MFMNCYVIPLSMVSYQKNIQNFVCLIMLLAKSPIDFDGIRCLDTPAWVCMLGFFCLNPVFRYRGTEMTKTSFLRV